LKKYIIIILVSAVYNVSAQKLKDDLASIIENYMTDSILNGAVLIAKGKKVIFKAHFLCPAISRSVLYC
jgi:hypothetical protein